MASCPKGKETLTTQKNKVKLISVFYRFIIIDHIGLVHAISLVRPPESAVGGEEDDDAGEGPSAAGHPAAPTPSTTRQSAGRVLTDAVLQLQRETIDAVNNLTEEMRQIRNVITKIATILKDTVKK